MVAHHLVTKRVELADTLFAFAIHAWMSSAAVTELPNGPIGHSMPQSLLQVWPNSYWYWAAHEVQGHCPYLA